MRSIFKVLGLALVITAILVVALAGTASAAGPLGSNPQAGDGISDGSSLDSPNGPCGTGGETGLEPGPAPNSGDGIPDGSGF
jgi:hypothetical protein